MNDDTASKAHLRLDHINGDLKEIKETVKENRSLISSTREEMASLKTELRIVGVIVLGAVSTLIAIILSNVVG